MQLQSYLNGLSHAFHGWMSNNSAYKTILVRNEHRPAYHCGTNRVIYGSSCEVMFEKWNELSGK